MTEVEIYAGTLNVVLKWPLMLSESGAFQCENGARMFWPAQLNGHRVWVYRWKNAPLHVAEIVSDVNIREQLSVDNGDLVSISIRMEHVESVSKLGMLVWLLAWGGRREWYYSNDRYHSALRPWCRRFGATQEVPRRSSLRVAVDVARGVLKKIPLVVRLVRSIKKSMRRGNRRSGGDGLVDTFCRVPLLSGQGETQRTLRQIQNVLAYTKTSGSAYAASQFSAGYHTLDILGTKLEGQRNPKMRVDAVPIDFAGKTVLDIGTNQGGMLFAVRDEVKWGVGLDYDPHMINAANRIKACENVGNLDFYVLDVDQEPLTLILDLVRDERIDLVFLLSVCMWIKKWKELIRFCADNCEAMLFESNGTEEQQSEQEAFLMTHYSDVRVLAQKSEDDPSQKRRRLFFCARSNYL